MQQQSAEPLCIQVRLGQASLVSLPAEVLPKRINWAKWADGVSIAQRVKMNRAVLAPRVFMSPDHTDPKDNLTFVATQNQSALENVDLFKLMNSISDETKLLFVGTWRQGLPSWFRSLQAVFAAKYANNIQDMLATQLNHWTSIGERIETGENFLVIDDVGRSSALVAVSKIWRARQSRANILAEGRHNSWFAATLELKMPRATEGEALRLHRLQVFRPEQWCGSPHFGQDAFPGAPNLKISPQVWLSAPGAGIGLWIADQFGLLPDSGTQLRLPSAILGWHPLRDLVAFIAGAPSGSVMFMVDGDVGLQVLMKESDGAA